MALPVAPVLICNTGLACMIGLIPGIFDISSFNCAITSSMEGRLPSFREAITLAWELGIFPVSPAMV